MKAKNINEHQESSNEETENQKYSKASSGAQAHAEPQRNIYQTRIIKQLENITTLEKGEEVRWSGR